MLDRSSHSTALEKNIYLHHRSFAAQLKKMQLFKPIKAFTDSVGPNFKLWTRGA
jgi:hypothetical protein